MSARFFWKAIAFWIAVLVVLSAAMALIPGSEKWPETVPIAVIVVVALGYLWYVKRKQRANPEAFKLSPRAQRNSLIANIAIFALFASTNFLSTHADPLRIGATVLWGLAALMSAYRLFILPPAESS